MQKSTRYTLFFFTAAFLLLTIGKSLYFSSKSGGTDLRCRVVGARLLATTNSPYFFKWKPTDGERLLDPNDNAARLVNGNVVTPAVLYTMYPLVQLSYPILRLIWTILEILAAIGCVLLTINGGRQEKKITAAVVTVGLICTDIFLFHVERGQMYVFYAFAMALSFYLFKQRKWRQGIFLSGMVAALLVFYRPFAAVLPLAFLLAGQKKWLWGYATGIVLGLLIFVAPSFKLWNDYSHAMKEYNNEILRKGTVRTNVIGYEHPAVIEGTTNLAEARGFNISGLHSLREYADKIGVEIGNIQFISLYILAVVIFSFLFWRSRKRENLIERIFLFGFLLYELAEIFMITPRGDYNSIEWLFPAAIIWRMLQSSLALRITMIVALLLLHNFPFVVPLQATLAELMLIGLLIYGIFMVGKNKQLDNGVSGNS